MANLSPYAKKRRFLWDHRVQMRVMEDVLEHHGLTEEYHAEAMVQELERELEKLKRALADQQAFIAAVQGVQEHQALRLKNERLRMQLEDRR